MAQLYPTHLALIAYAREHGLNRADAEELADALDMHFRDRQLVSYAMGGPLGISEKVNRANRTGRTRRLREAAGPDYESAHYNMDKWMPDDPDLMDEFYDAEAIGDRERLLDVLLDADEDRFHREAGPGASLEGFVDWMLSS